MRCYGKMEGLNWLLQLGLLQLWRISVAVCEMAEFVCHTPDHNQGIRVKVGWVKAREGEKTEGRRGKKQRSKRIKLAFGPSHQTWLDTSHSGYNGTCLW
jgi:hypothetical protein